MGIHFDRRLLALSVLAALPSAPTWAQVPAGTQFPINTYTTGDQFPHTFAHAAAVAPNGDVVVVWSSPGQDGSGEGVFARRIGANGSPSGPEFRVNSYTTGTQSGGTVAFDRRGNSIIAWQSDAQDGSAFGVYAQRYDAAGVQRGSEFRVNTTTSGSQWLPGVGADDRGGFVVVWSGPDPGSSNEVFAQRFDSAGAALGAEFRVSSNVPTFRVRPSIDVNSAGNFVVMWEAAGPQIWGRRFDASGVPQGPDFHINSSGSAVNPRAALAGDGSFVVTWDGQNAPGDTLGIFAHRYDASGTALGPDFLVNSYTTGDQFKADVDGDESGNFVVTWQNGLPFAGQIAAQRYDSVGSRRGAEFRVDAGPAQSMYPSAASDRAGNFVVAWASGVYPGGLDMVGQRFGGLVPTALAVDASAAPNSNGNGVLEAGETVGVGPTWRNVNGAAQTISGVASGFSGPGTSTYTLVDGSASYGTIANGAAANCAVTGDCYTVGLTVPGARPATHWDATLREDILPAVQGQAKPWSLHVGDSFTDVPRTSPFYRFVETLLHHEITAGCSATQYCPATPTTRDLMAVFVLVAKERIGYVPPACGATPMFTDVPASHPVCRWIEELARRGVVGGCGPGLYCPNGVVSREQMAVFVLRTLDPTVNPSACTPPNLYSDVPETSPFCRWIEELTRRGVVSGCGSGNYCPTTAVNREQMAVFIGVTFALTLYGL